MNFRIGLITSLLLLTICIPACVDVVEAEYDYQDNILFIDAYALTETGSSTVNIKRTFWDGRNYSVRPLSNAKVRMDNIETDDSIEFLEGESGTYECPPDFAARQGEVWKLYIELEDGKKLESKAETVTASVPIDGIGFEYSPEVKFDNFQNRFIPGHNINIDWTDPAGEENYYLWKYKSYQPLFVCKTCIRGVLRDGECQPSNANWFPAYYDYLCTPNCWKIEYEQETIIFEDRISDGTNINNYNVATIAFNRSPNILIEVQQLSINKSAYEYFKIIDDQINASGGLNAPPAAPLLGNLYNPDDPSDYVLGQFTTAGVATKSLFIDRSNIIENPINPDPVIRLEPVCPSCPTTYPCQESRFRTAIEPEGWQ